MSGLLICIYVKSAKTRFCNALSVLVLKVVVGKEGKGRGRSVGRKVKLVSQEMWMWKGKRPLAAVWSGMKANVGRKARDRARMMSARRVHTKTDVGSDECVSVYCVCVLARQW